MSLIRLVLALHNHQPVGNFDRVIEAAFRDGYLPFLEVMEDYADIPFVLHTSGPLLEWLVQRQPDYIARLRVLVETGRVEILSGGFYEPILTMIPRRDRIGQIRSFSRYLAEVFGSEVRGMWLPERVWEQQLVSSIVEAGIEYTLLDDLHFVNAGVDEHRLCGYFLTEDEGRVLKVFPGSERLRYAIPFQEPHVSYEFLRQLATEQPGSTVVFADDGEKLGAWPSTYEHVYRNGWLRRFCDMIVANRDWLEPTTLARTVTVTLPLGKVYLPDGSYREMTEWALGASRLTEFRNAVELGQGEPAVDRLQPFVRAGGSWRNFLGRYTESGEMHARMVGLSDRLAEVEAVPDADPDYLEWARQELYRSQCNCAYWHGTFGGLYLPHLRGAVYRHLIAAHNALDEAEGRSSARVALEVADFNLDARQEVRIENDRLIAFVRPAVGGHVYELDVRHAETNVLATLDRRPESYHGLIAASVASGSALIAENGAGRISLERKHLDRLLVYDRHPRKALVDHFYPAEVTLDDLLACRDLERGDFVQGTYLSRFCRGDRRVQLIMERPGRAAEHIIRLRKTIELSAGCSYFDVHYTLEDLAPSAVLHFAVEINLASMAGHASDRYYTDASGLNLGMLDTPLDLSETDGIRLSDEWLDLAVALGWSRPAGLWCYPIATLSQSEGGYEAVYQSSAIVPHWHISGAASPRWDVHIRWDLDRVAALTGSSARSLTTYSTK